MTGLVKQCAPSNVLERVQLGGVPCVHVYWPTNHDKDFIHSWIVERFERSKRSCTCRPI